MFIRRKPNKSGSFSVQVLDKRNGRNVLLRSFGASKDENELRELERQAADYILRYGGQQVLDFEIGLPPSPEEEAEAFFSRITDIRHDAPRIILGKVYETTLGSMPLKTTFCAHWLLRGSVSQRVKLRQPSISDAVLERIISCIKSTAIWTSSMTPGAS